MDKNRVFGLFICMLLLIGTFLPITGSTVTKPGSHILTTETILYVGGVGPNNYTKIQDAIDNATDGDTVFVFANSSPYRENLQINNSIFLLGEDKDSTIIDGENQSDTVNLTADNVTIMEFTIRNGNDSGILISSNDNKISNNIFTGNEMAIRTIFGELFQSFQNNAIAFNRFMNNGAGITFYGGKNVRIWGNVFTNTWDAISLNGVMNSVICENTFSNNDNGIWIMISYNTQIYWNNISHCKNIGLFTVCGNADKILQNNFIGNNISAVSTQYFPPQLKMWKELDVPVFRRNVWKGNYWDEPRSTPYMIPGVFLKLRFHFDWFPAQTPYDIPEMS